MRVRQMGGVLNFVARAVSAGDSIAPWGQSGTPGRQSLNSLPGTSKRSTIFDMAMSAIESRPLLVPVLMLTSRPGAERMIDFALRQCLLQFLQTGIGDLRVDKCQRLQALQAGKVLYPCVRYLREGKVESLQAL
jgi:hypothetical protein